MSNGEILAVINGAAVLLVVFGKLDNAWVILGLVAQTVIIGLLMTFSEFHLRCTGFGSCWEQEMADEMLLK